MSQRGTASDLQTRRSHFEAWVLTVVDSVFTFKRHIIGPYCPLRYQCCDAWGTPDAYAWLLCGMS